MSFVENRSSMFFFIDFQKQVWVSSYPFSYVYVYTIYRLRTTSKKTNKHKAFYFLCNTRDHPCAIPRAARDEVRDELKNWAHARRRHTHHHLYFIHSHHNSHVICALHFPIDTDTRNARNAEKNKGGYNNCCTYERRNHRNNNKY